MNAEEDRNIARLWKINRTIHELVKDRSFEVSEDEIQLDFAGFKSLYAAHGSVDKTKLNFFTNKLSDPDDRIFVFFADEKNVSIKTMRKFLGIIDEKGISRGIIIYPEKMTPSAKKVIGAMSASYTLEDFEEASLLVNITHHTLVPKHEVLTPAEKKMLLEKYRLKDTQLPRIQLSDPVARYYGLTRGQVVKITRPSETSGRYASYRIAF